MSSTINTSDYETANTSLGSQYTITSPLLVLMVTLFQVLRLPLI